MNRKKWLLLVITILTLSIITVLLIVNKKYNYENLIVNDSKWNDIINKRKDNNINFENIKFNDYSLIIDGDNIYYSLVESSNKYNPKISFTSDKKGTKVVVKENITDEKISNNNDFKIMIYDNSSYHIYNLKVTTLPILNLSYSNNEKQKNINLADLYLFDNSKDAFNRNVRSKVDFKIIDNNEKKNYSFSLKLESLGNNKRENNISILGMQKHSEYILNSMSEDQDKIRNVFTTNLWNEMVKEKNDEYKYVELFINNEYVGLYSLGYNIERESLRLREGEFLFFKKDLTSSENKYNSNTKLAGYQLYDHIMNKMPKREDNIPVNCKDENKDGCKRIDAWEQLNSYYEVLNSSNINSIKEVADINNSIDLYLFYLFIQPTNNINSETFSNTYLVFKRNMETGKDYLVKYIPWNLDYTFGNSNNENTVVNSSDNSYIMVNNPVYRLLKLNDNETKELLKKRYTELRNSVWGEDFLLNMIEEKEKEINSSGAFIRDSIKWNNTKENDLESLKEYIVERLTYMDSYIDKL